MRLLGQEEEEGGITLELTGGQVVLQAYVIIYIDVTIFMVSQFGINVIRKVDPRPCPFRCVSHPTVHIHQPCRMHHRVRREQRDVFTCDRGSRQESAQGDARFAKEELEKIGCGCAE